MEIDKIDKNILKVNDRRKSVYILHYSKGKLHLSFGLINDKIGSKINHFCNTEVGSSGSPILSLESYKIVGIYYGGSNINLNFCTFINDVIEEFNNYYSYNKYKNGNLIYNNENENETKIFGTKFVENNKNNIELIINGIKDRLIENYKLKQGDNNIRIIIKNKLINLGYMFDGCESLKNIDELKYLNTKDIINFAYIFHGCSSLSDIKPLENWNVSNGKNFSYMFNGCSSLSNIEPLQNWNVSNCSDFPGMFGDVHYYQI